MQLVSASPGRLALLWAIAAFLGIANAVAFPSDDMRPVSSTLYFSGVSIFTGLVVAWVLRLERSTLHLLSALTSLGLAASLAAIALKLTTPAASHGLVIGILDSLVLLGVAFIIYFGCGALRSRRRRAVAIVLAVGVNVAAVAMLYLDGPLWGLSAEMQPLLGRPDSSASADDQTPDFADDRIWEAQPTLIESQRGALEPHAPGRANVYAIAVAASGAQALFSREAHEALRVAALHFGDDSRGGALLSNGAADLLHSPLATRANVATIAQAIAEKADRKRDVLFVYLASHGSQTAELASTLPGDRSVQPISAATTAEALHTAGIARRVIVVSACYSATWIPALADDNTIVITAAAKDRTSFGCDDSRRFTVFGEAFLGSLGARRVSLHDAFEEAKRKIAAQERAQNVTPSLPQIFVGRNMQALWLGERDGDLGEGNSPRGSLAPLGPLSTREFRRAP